MPPPEPPRPLHRLFLAGLALLLLQLLVGCCLVCPLFFFIEETVPCGWQFLWRYLPGALALPAGLFVVAAVYAMAIRKVGAAALLFLGWNLFGCVMGVAWVTGPDPRSGRNELVHHDLSQCRRSASIYARDEPRCDRGDAQACERLMYTHDPSGFQVEGSRQTRAMEHGCAAGSNPCCQALATDRARRQRRGY